jgi:hypothetical protein
LQPNVRPDLLCPQARRSLIRLVHTRPSEKDLS